MRFRQKPPTKPGYYWALGNNDDEMMWVLVRESDGRLYVEVEDNYGGSEDSLSEYHLWSAEPIAPAEPPAFKMPKRWINYHKPAKTPLPKSCRRWGHKWVWDGEALAAYNESFKSAVTPEIELDGKIIMPRTSAYQSYYMLFGPDTFLKCARCNAKDAYNSRSRNMFLDEAFSNKNYDPSESASSLSYGDVQNIIERMKTDKL
jgi:hypothetical protein